MNRNEFELKLKEAGFESGAEFAKKLKILRASVTEWHKYKYPEYVECVLNYTIQVRKIDLIKKNNDINAFLKEKIQLYKKENWVLEDKIKELKAVLNEKMTREELDALIEKCNEKAVLNEKHTQNKIIDENYNEKMTREEFDALIEKCNIKTYIELANILNINPQTIFNWNKEATYPKYLKQLLEWLIFIKKYEKEAL